MPASDLVSRAARFFVLAEQASRLEWRLDESFWGLSVSPVEETVSHLPAMTAAVRTVHPNDFWPGVLRNALSQPLPRLLPPEAVSWHNCLIAAWEVHHTLSDAKLQNLARLVLVRLDSCGMPDGHERLSRLPEWLAEAQKIASGEWRVVDGAWRVASARGSRDPNWDRYLELEALAALAAWRPSTRVITPPETLREWVSFWMKLRRSADPVEKGLAAIALLNLPEADLRAASIPPVPAGELLQQLATSIQSTAHRTNQNYLFLLNWQPVKGTTCPVAEVRNVAQTWLDVTRHGGWMDRRAAWQQLIRWDRAGSLNICGMDLLPELVQAVPTEEDGWVLWEMAQWLPTAELPPSTGTPGRRSLLQQLEGAWLRYRSSGDSWTKALAWLSRIRLQQAGLADEPTESFLEAYLSAVADERDYNVLFILAHWSPGPAAPGKWHRDWKAAWQQRFLGNNRDIQQIATLALLRQSLETEQGRLLRGTALELWRAGTKASSKARHILDAAFSRFQEVRAHLAAGEVPDLKKKLPRPAERRRPLLALPPGRIAGREWQMKNEKWKMENEGMKHQEATPNLRLVPDCLSR